MLEVAIETDGVTTAETDTVTLLEVTVTPFAHCEEAVTTQTTTSLLLNEEDV